VLLAAVGLGLLVMDVRNVTDPCREWGIGPGIHVQEMVPPCEQHRSATSEPRWFAIARTIIIDGGLLTLAAMAVFGIWRVTRRSCTRAAVIALGYYGLLLISGRVFMLSRLNFILVMGVGLLIAGRFVNHEPHNG
jgi:hypothetical protein